MRRRARIIVVWMLSAVLALALVGCGHPSAVSVPWERSAPPAGLTLTDLHGIADLQTAFNQDAGRPRLIMLVSPT